MIEELTQQKHSLGLRVEELEVKVHSLSSSLKKKEREAEVGLPPNVHAYTFIHI